MCMCATISLERYWCPDHINLLYTGHDVCIHLCLGSLIIIHLFMMLPSVNVLCRRKLRNQFIISYTFLFPFKEQHSFFITRAYKHAIFLFAKTKSFQPSFFISACQFCGIVCLFLLLFVLFLLIESSILCLL